LLLLWLALDRLQTQRQLAARLVRWDLLEGPEVTVEHRPRQPLRALLQRLGAFLVPCWPQRRLRRWRRTLIQAGLLDRYSVEELLALRVVAMVVGVALCASAVVLLGPAGLAAAVLGGMAGYLLPSLVVARIAAQRRAAIERLLPGTIDMLVVSLVAGLSFDSAVSFICERLDNELIRELRRYLADMQLGRSRRDALEAMVERTRSAGVSQFVRAVVQADELGSGLARTLRGQAHALREVRRLRAQERAGQAAIKLTFPLVIFMMPALFILILSPAVIQSARMFQGR
jgi:tight adherence protein C